MTTPRLDRVQRAVTAKRRRAFTLIEALVTMVIVAVVLTVTMEGISLATRVTSAARRRDSAATLAAGKLDELVITNAWQTGRMSGDFGADWPEYRWAATIGPWENGTMNELKVSVSWNDRSGDQSVSITTLISTDTSSTSVTTGGT